MKKIVLLFCVLPILIFSGCNRIDYDAFLTFVVYEIDYENLELEGAAVFSFTNPKLRPNESIPLEFNHIEPTFQIDGASGVYYPLENTQIFDATLSINGIGQISKPQFTEEKDLSKSEKSASFITGMPLIPFIKAPPVEYRMFWDVVKNYEITHSITHGEMDAYIYLYEAKANDSSTWKWILMLAH